MTGTAESRFGGGQQLAAGAADTVRIMGELVHLVMNQHGGVTGYRFHPGIAVREMGNGKVLLTGAQTPSMTGEVKAIVYSAADNRTAPETKGKEVIHIFITPPTLELTREGTWLAGGNYVASEAGIIG